MNPTNARASSYFTIVTARNSESIIREALLSHRHQTVPATAVIVIDDGSNDFTPEIVRELQHQWKDLHLIRLPDMGYDISRVVSNWNNAIQHARSSGLAAGADYHMIATDDTLYPASYASDMISYMDTHPDVAVVSGRCGSSSDTTSPRGAGRFVRNAFFENTRWHGEYPKKMGYESAILIEANLLGYRNHVCNEIMFDHIRKLGNVHKFQEFGASMKVLGYHPIFAIGRTIQNLINGKGTGRIGAFYMFYSYLTYSPAGGYDDYYDMDIRRYVRKSQEQRLANLISRRVRTDKMSDRVAGLKYKPQASYHSAPA